MTGQPTVAKPANDRAAAGPALQPLANYAAAKRFGDTLYLSGVVAVDPAARHVLADYAQLPETAQTALRALGYVTGQMSVDAFEAPIVTQSWFVLNRIAQIAHDHGAHMGQATRLVQYFKDLRHYPAYNRVRGLFFEQPVVSTVVEVSRLLPSDAVLIEVEATFWLGDSGAAASHLG